MLWGFFKMLEKIKTFKESNPKLRKIMLAVMSLLVIGSLFSFFTGFKKLNANYGDIHFIQSLEMDREKIMMKIQLFVMLPL